MGRTTRITASLLATAAVGIAGSQAPALATSATDTCSHGVVANNSGHKYVEFLSSRDVGDTHIHKYKHATGFFVSTHTRERNC